jgi:hypothetical protein
MFRCGVSQIEAVPEELPRAPEMSPLGEFYHDKSPNKVNGMDIGFSNDPSDCA